MANKYIRHGETFCGNGTTSAAATSNSAADNGAWNNINVFEGTAPAFGTAPVAGDTVYIRSKDAAGANTTRTLASNVQLGGTAGTPTNQVKWILDGGTVWPGIDGVLKYITGSGTVLIAANIYIACQTQDALFFHTDTTWPGTSAMELNGYLKNAKIQDDDRSTTLPCISMGFYLYGWAVGENLHFVIGRNTGTRIQSNGLARLINPDIEQLSTDAGLTAFQLNSNYSQGRMEVIGGRLRGAGAADNLTLVYPSPSNYSTCLGFLAVGFNVPRSMPICNSSANTRNARIELIGLEGGIGAHLDEAWGFATSRTDNYPPTLNAQLPNSTLTPWAWRVYPKAASFMNPVHLISSKVFTGAAGVKAITQDFLAATTFVPTKATAWLTVEYTDNATGEPRHLSTIDFGGAALDASTANWSATTWGMVAFNKVKLQITTPTAVKQDTMITVAFCFALPSATASDILFIDPDFSVT